MGPYCKFCDRRCFLPRILSDGRSTLLTTCPQGMEHDRTVTGQDHTTAINPAAPPYVRPGHTLIKITEPDPRPCGHTDCARQVVAVMCDNGQPPDPIFGLASTYTTYAHTDGTPGHGDLDITRPMWRCERCHTHGKPTIVQGPYGDTITCAHCGDERYHDIGD